MSGYVSSKRKTNYFLLFSSLVQMNIHILFCPIYILLPLAYKLQIQHFYSLLFPLQRIGVWKQLHSLKELIYKNNSAGKKNKPLIDSDLLQDFAVRTAWACGSSCTHELRKPHMENVEGQGERGAHHVLRRDPRGRGLTQHRQMPVLSFCLLFSWTSASMVAQSSKAGSQLALKLARDVKNNKDFIGMFVQGRDRLAAERGWQISYKWHRKVWFTQCLLCLSLHG